jgi:hypothetical protein
MKYRHWTKQEKEEAPWLWMSFAFGEDGQAGPRFGNPYDRTGACKACGAGARHVERVVTSWKPNLKRRVHRLLTGEWLVSDETKGALDEAGVRGVDWLPVHAPGQAERPAGFWMLSPLRTAPRAHPGSRLAQNEGCPVCERTCWYGLEDTQRLYIYRQQDLDPEVDALRIWEIVGPCVLEQPFEQSKLGMEEVLVSRRFYRALRAASAARGLEFMPVESAD